MAQRISVAQMMWQKIEMHVKEYNNWILAALKNKQTENISKLNFNIK